MIAQKTSPTDVVEMQLKAYNLGNIDDFMSVFSEDITLWNLGESQPWASGFDQVKGIYLNLFENSPNLYSTVINRSTIGNKVIDYEYITGRNGSDRIYLVMVYEVRDGKIFRATAIRE